MPFKNLYKIKEDTEKEDQRTIVDGNGEGEPPSYDELAEVVNQFKRNKNSKSNELSNELIRYDGKIL